MALMMSAVVKDADGLLERCCGLTRELLLRGFNRLLACAAGFPAPLAT